MLMFLCYIPGYLRDVTGSYSVCFLCMGTCMVMGGLPLLLVFNEVSESSKMTVNKENSNCQGEVVAKE